MQPPDEDLCGIQVSLSEFVSVAQHLYTLEDTEDFLRFVLAGRLKRDDMTARIFINARQGVLAPPISQYQLHRDIDSLIGVTRNLPFRLPMSIFPLASFRDSLTKDNHLKCTLSYPQVGRLLSTSGILTDSPTFIRMLQGFHFTKFPTCLWEKLADVTSPASSSPGCMTGVKVLPFPQRPWLSSMINAFGLRSLVSTLLIRVDGRLPILPP